MNAVELMMVHHRWWEGSILLKTHTKYPETIKSQSKLIWVLKTMADALHPDRFQAGTRNGTFQDNDYIHYYSHLELVIIQQE